jgi:hypothetical protein
MKNQQNPSDDQQNEYNKFSEFAKKLFSVPKPEIQPKQPKQKPTKA